MLSNNEEKASKYMILARTNADLFSKDPHTKVGAILLDSEFSRILSTGINGFPRNMNDNMKSRWERPTKYKYVAHAEMNAICNAAKSGVSLDNSIAIVTLFPCSNCAKALIQAGIKKIYVPENCMKCNIEEWEDDFKVSREMLNEVNIDINIIKS
jgi:dCMP deaminase